MTFVSSFKSDVPSILVYRIGHLGDTLVAMPAIQSICNKYPNHSIILITEKRIYAKHYISSWDVLEPTGWFDMVVFYEVSVGFFHKVMSLSKLYIKLKKLNIQHTYNLSPDRSSFQRSRDRFFFKYLLGITGYTDSAPFVAHEKNLDGTLPMIEPEWHRLLKVVQESDQEFCFRLPIPPSYVVETANIIKSLSINSGSILIALAPGSKMPSKVWPVEYFIGLGHVIHSNNPEAIFLVFGGKEDENVGDILCKEWGSNAHNLAGKLSIYGSASLLERCRIYVGNDTGTMHLAAMTGVPCVAIFSSRDYPGKWEPFGRGHTVLRREVECSGCMLDVCDKSNKCLKSISVQDVAQQVFSMLHHDKDNSTQ